MRSGATILLAVVGLLSATPQSRGQAEPSSGQGLPKIVLVGDSIRMGYAPLVARRLEGKAVVVSSPENGGDSASVLAHLDEWVIREKPDVVHLNCGLHDLKRSRNDGPHQVELDRYAENLRQIVARIRERTDAALVFADTTPILDDRHARRGADFDRTEADVRRYNAAAVAVMAGLGVPVHALHWVVEQGGPEAMLGPDGTHYTAAGSGRLAEAVADCVLRQVTVRRYRPLPRPASGAEAAAAYEKVQRERDALVPKAYQRLKVGEFRVPEHAAEWKEQRPAVLRAVVESLGDLPPRPAPPRARVISRELRPGYTLERIAIENGVDGEVSALFLVPTERKEPVPAILWLHSSTPDKTQVIISGTNGGEESLGEAFVRAGYAVLSPDAYWHGDRVATGPAGATETGRAEQESLLKLNLWFGRTLWGMFVRDDQIALDYLCSRPEVDTSRIGATGMSMGSTRAWWLAAVDERVAAVVAVACLTRYQNLIAHGELRAHGVYYFVNGLLKHFDTEGVLALVAPRPFLALTGELDAGSPADGVRALERAVGGTYQALAAGDRFKSVLYPEVGHAYTPEMRAEMLAWFARWLRPQPTQTTVQRSTVGPIPPGVSLDPFYKKHTDALGIPIVSSEKVPDAALLVARDIVIHMLAKRPDVREALVARKMRVVVMAQSESTTDLPEQRNWKKPGPNDPRLTQRERDNYEQGIGRMTDKEYWDRRARGMGGNLTSGAEENLLGYPGTRYFGENILVHEFSHAIMDVGLRRSDPKLVAAIRDAYKEAMRKGLWKNHYASTNASEYWAEGTQTWFWSNYEYVDGERRVQSPDDLKAYDPTLYELLERVYPDHHIPADIYHGKNLKPGRRRPITPEPDAGESTPKDR